MAGLSTWQKERSSRDRRKAALSSRRAAPLLALPTLSLDALSEAKEPCPSSSPRCLSPSRAEQPTSATPAEVRLRAPGGVLAKTAPRSTERGEIRGDAQRESARHSDRRLAKKAADDSCATGLRAESSSLSKRRATATLSIPSLCFAKDSQRERLRFTEEASADRAP